MLEIHVKQKMLDDDEIGIMQGAMHYKRKPVSSIMTPIDKAFMLPISFPFIYNLFQIIVYNVTLTLRKTSRQN